MTEVKVCIDKFIDPALAAETAVEHNPENWPFGGMGPEDFAIGNHNRDVRAAGVILTGRKWQVGKTITVAFMGGDPRVNERITNTAREWEKFVNLKLAFIENPADAEIRIAQDKNDGSWSYLGTSNLTIPKNEPTMNFGWLEPDTSQTEYSRVVKHEFGHMFGFPHEHSSPAASEIPWDHEAVYSLYIRTQGWTKEDVDQQVFYRYSESQTQFTALDKQSIMLYAIPNDLTIGDYEVGWNTDLSIGDKKFAEWQYPFPAAPPPPPPPPGPPVEARVKVSLSSLERNASRFYGKKLTIAHNGRSRWDANPV